MAFGAAVALSLALLTAERQPLRTHLSNAFHSPPALLAALGWGLAGAHARVLFPDLETVTTAQEALRLAPQWAGACVLALSMLPGFAPVAAAGLAFLLTAGGADLPGMGLAGLVAGATGRLAGNGGRGAAALLLTLGVETLHLLGPQSGA